MVTSLSHANLSSLLIDFASWNKFSHFSSSFSSHYFITASLIINICILLSKNFLLAIDDCSKRNPAFCTTREVTVLEPYWESLSRSSGIANYRTANAFLPDIIFLTKGFVQVREFMVGVLMVSDTIRVEIESEFIWITFVIHVVYNRQLNVKIAVRNGNQSEPLNSVIILLPVLIEFLNRTHATADFSKIIIILANDNNEMPVIIFCWSFIK